jgi:cytochrome c553
LLLPDPPYFEAWDNKALLEQPTYSRHIAPMINASCAECHRQEGMAHLVVSVPPHATAALTYV